MKDTNKLERDIKLYDMQLKSNANDHNTYSLKGKTYVELARITSNEEFYSYAIDSFTTAIEIYEKPSYLCDRAKIYALIGESEKAVNDFRKVNEITSTQKSDDILGDLYVKNTLKDIAKIDSIKSTIQDLRKNQKLPEEFLNAFDSLTNITSNLSIKVEDHTGQLQQIWSIIDTINSKLTQNKEITDNDYKVIEDVLALHGKKLDTHDNQIKNQGKILDNAGVKERAEIKEKFTELEKYNPELHIYCKTFYWTCINLFDSYRNLSTGIIKGVSEEMSPLAKGAMTLCSKIPLIGSATGAIQSIVEGVYTVLADKKLENTTNAVNKVIQAKFGLSDEISINIAKVAIALTEIRKEAILHPEKNELSKFEAGIKWIEDKIDSVKEKIMPSVNLHDKSNNTIKIALEDVTGLIAYIAVHSDNITINKDLIDKQCISIIQCGALNQLLKEAASVEKAQVQMQEMHPLLIDNNKENNKTIQGKT